MGYQQAEENHYYEPTEDEILQVSWNRSGFKRLCFVDTECPILVY